MATVACFKSREHLLILIPQQNVFFFSHSTKCLLQVLNEVFFSVTQQSVFFSVTQQRVFFQSLNKVLLQVLNEVR